MNIRQVESRIVEAMKAKDIFARDVYRGLKDALQKEAKKTNIDASKLTQDQFNIVVRREIKAYNDVIDAVKSKSKADIAFSGVVQEKQKAIQMLTEYLPQQLSFDEVKVHVANILGDVRESGIKVGEAMRLVMAELKGKADGKLINQAVSQHINA